MIQDSSPWLPFTTLTQKSVWANQFYLSAEGRYTDKHVITDGSSVDYLHFWSIQDCAWDFVPLNVVT